MSHKRVLEVVVEEVDDDDYCSSEDSDYVEPSGFELQEIEEEDAKLDKEFESIEEEEEEDEEEDDKEMTEAPQASGSSSAPPAVSEPEPAAQ